VNAETLANRCGELLVTFLLCTSYSGISLPCLQHLALFSRVSLWSVWVYDNITWFRDSHWGCGLVLHCTITL